MGILISVILPLSLAFIMFSLGLGLTLADFRRVLTRPFAFLVGAFNQMVVVPIVAFVMIVLFSPPPELAVGIMILSFCPGGVTSNIISRLAKGDVALSVSLTAVISLASILTVPILVAWSVGHFMGAAAPDITVTRLAVSMFLITTLPVVIGAVIRHKAPEFSHRAMPMFNKLATLLFVVIVAVAIAANWSVLVENLEILAPALITINIQLIVLGIAIPVMFGLDFAEVKTIAVETGVQNSTVGITLGAIVGGQAVGFSAYTLPAAIYGITMYLVALPVVLWLRAR
jgi:BASS family bile acid:Na+ symporter